MKYFLIFLAILLISIFQTTFVGFNFLLLLVLISSLALSPSWSLFIAFLAGFILDLFSGGGLGYSSLGFILSCFLLILYRQRFSFQNPLSCFGITFVSYLLFSLISRKPLIFWEGFFLGISLIGLRFLVPFLFRIKDQGQLRIEL